MLTKTLIVNTNLGVSIETYEDCYAANIVVTEFIKRSIYEICEFLNFDSSLVTVGYKPLTCSVDLYDGYTCGLSEINLEALTQPISNFIETTFSQLRVQHATGLDEAVKLRVNFHVAFIATGTIILTEEVFRV